ncbi:MULTISPECIES: 5-fold beta-flower protein [unclassified Spirosoma]|jgi:hypothetical protein|uniref:5-fold beta-flower protein n=2 Tax=Spirosoma TaxID=107 RepID=UPI000A9930DE|nr:MULTISPECIES: hypothetical protein [unclassified Spirosoma]
MLFFPNLLQKKIYTKMMRFVALTLLLLTPFLAQAQQPVKDYKGHILTSSGQIQQNGITVGTVSKEGIIQDAKGKKIAFLKADGTMVDANGKLLGRMAKDGMSFYNETGGLVFTLKDRPDDTCDLIDAKGNVVGNVHDSLKGSACALHCFQAGMKNKPDHSKMKH